MEAVRGSRCRSSIVSLTVLMAGPTIAPGESRAIIRTDTSECGDLLLDEEHIPSRNYWTRFPQEWVGLPWPGAIKDAACGHRD